MEKRVYLASLYDIYGSILTEKQRLTYEMHEQDDLSLSEISEELSVSRQGVSDQLQRARDRLEELERSLGIRARLNDLESRLSSLEELLSSWREDLPGEFAERAFEILSGVGGKD